MPRILFIGSNHQDYLADGVFHGLRSLLGSDAVDFPKAEYLYDSAPPAVLADLHGRGFTLYGLLPDMAVARHHVLPRALSGEFDLVVFGDIWRSFGLWTECGPQLRRGGIRVAVLDGADSPAPYPYAGRWWRNRAWWFLPRAHNRAFYFKREITPRTRQRASYMLLPPRLGRTLGIRPTSFCIPVEKVAASPPVKDKDFPRHVIDEEVAERLDRDTSHPFLTEADYYEDLRRSRYGITTKRAGWDALRHYEIAANGAVPCFRNLHRKPESCAPFGLHEGNCLAYRDAGHLFEQLGMIDDARYLELQAGALAWARANTTVARAQELLAACGIPLGPGDGRPASRLPS
jgi:hypothetical protein